MDSRLDMTCLIPELEHLLNKDVEVTLVIRSKLTGYFKDAIVLSNVGICAQYIIGTNQACFDIHSVKEGAHA